MRKARLGLESMEREAERLRTLLPGEWVLIAETVLSGSAASVTFSSISSSYRTLAMVLQARTDRAASAIDLVEWQANGDAGNNYDRTYLIGTIAGAVVAGGNLGVASAYLGSIDGSTARANNFGIAICYWPGYADTSKEKYSITTGSWRIADAVAANTYVGNWAGHWRNTNAITSLTILPTVGPNFVAGSQFSLYGIW